MEGRGMSQTTPSYLTNRDLFSNHYLTKHLPETEVWETTDEDELRRVYEEIEDLYNRRKDAVSGYNESMLEQRFIRPIFDILDIDYGVEETVKNTRRRPDYGFFKTDEAVDEAFQRTNAGGDFYEDAIGVADAKKWGRSLDTQGDDRHTVENPSFQISVYLDETSADWAVLTNGEQWRIYYAKTAHRLDSYYEVDLPTLLDVCDPDSENGLEPFKHFYHFFRRRAFTETDRECFLNRVLEESNIFAQELGEDLKGNIYDAIEVLADGFLQYDENDLDEDDIDQIHDASLIYLYRLIFVLYAESEGRNLLDTTNRYYRERYSLNTLKQDIAEKRDDASYTYPSWEDDLWERLNDLFELIDTGSEAKGIPEDELHIPAYNGGLFRTEPGEDDPREAHFLQENKVSDQHLAEVIDLLTRSEAGNNGDGLTFVDYSSLGIRHLGSIYEGLLEYQLNVAEEPLRVEDSEYVPVSDGEEPVVKEGDVYLTTDAGERKATGSYYTPDYVVEYIVENTIDPHLTDIRNDLLGEHHQFAEQFADRVFDLKILDPAMGSGHFLTEAIDYLAREIIDAQQRQAEQQDEPDIDESRDINWARRQVAQKCIYGVDINPMAVELAKVSLWLRTLAAEQPLAFLDHHLKTGNSLIGSDIEEIVDENGAERSEDDDEEDNEEALQQVTLEYDYHQTKKEALEELMDIYEEFIAIENRERGDVKEMERKYNEIERNKLRNRLIEMANVRTAEQYGHDIPGGVYKQLAEALNDDEAWREIEKNEEWFRDAQDLARDVSFFHWKLQFPEVFYDENAELRENSGFDVVIGNPPWIDVKGLEDPDVLYTFYDTSFNRVNIYGAFFEGSVDLLREGGHFGFVTPNSFMTQSSYEELRHYLAENLTFDSFVRLPDDVFDGVTMESAITTANKQSSGSVQSDKVEALIYDRDIDIETIPSEKATQKRINPSRWEDDDLIFDIFTSDDEYEVLNKMDEQSQTVEDLFETCLGITPYDKHVGHTEEQIDNRVFHTESKESDEHYKVTTGSGIQRYKLTWEGDEWIHYGDWLGSPREKRFFTEPRCVVRQIVSRDSRGINATYADETMFHTQVGFVLLPKDGSKRKARNIAGILNSKLLTFYHRKRYLDEKKDTFQKILIQDAKEFPLPEEIEDESLHNAVKKIEAKIDERASINLNLLDYLGNYGEGPTLANLSGTQPAQGVGSSILAETADDKENLRIGTLAVEEDGDDLIITATARFKPDDPESNSVETDRWGYVETDGVPALRYSGSNERTKELIKEFVDLVQEEDDGFADFRTNATSGISPLERIEGIILPDVNDVVEGLDRYLSVKDRAETLDGEIEDLERQIDHIVYTLYDLEEQDIETIESSFEEESV